MNRIRYGNPSKERNRIYSNLHEQDKTEQKAKSINSNIGLPIICTISLYMWVAVYIPTTGARRYTIIFRKITIFRVLSVFNLQRPGMKKKPGSNEAIRLIAALQVLNHIYMVNSIKCTLFNWVMDGNGRLSLRYNWRISV